MGNQASNPQLAQLIQNIKPTAPPPPDPRAEVERKRIELTMARNDLRKKQEEFDKIAPDELTKRKTDEANNELAKFKNTQVRQYEIELKLYDNVMEQLRVSIDNPAQELAKRYKEVINEKEHKIARKFNNNREEAITNRRRFLDADPQEGVGGIGWYQSADQQVMLVFWVSYVLFVITAITLYMLEYGAGNLGSAKNMGITGALVFFAALFLGHIFIKTFVAS
jgi:hypothetical protein